MKNINRIFFPTPVGTSVPEETGEERGAEQVSLHPSVDSSTGSSQRKGSKQKFVFCV